MAVTADDLATLPKVELHVHLEGSISAQTAIALARRHGEDPDVVLPLVDGGYPPRFDDFGQFVRLYLAVTEQVRTPDDLAKVARDFATAQAAQGVRHTEATFTATSMVNIAGLDPAAMWEALRHGFDAVAETRVRLIVDAVRDMGVANGHQTVQLVGDALADGYGDLIVAFGLAGTETAANEEDFTMLPAAAEELGIRVVAHAGEIGGPDNIRRALDVLGSARIGHGVACMRDPDLVRRLAAEEVVLEVCPTSNVVLRVVEGLANHPLPAMADAGLAVTINSDDPPYFSTTLTDELGHAARLLDLDRGGLAELQRRAAAATLLPPEARADLIAEIDAWEAAT